MRYTSAEKIAATSPGTRYTTAINRITRYKTNRSGNQAGGNGFLIPAVRLLRWNGISSSSTDREPIRMEDARFFASSMTLIPEDLCFSVGNSFVYSRCTDGFSIIHDEDAVCRRCSWSTSAKASFPSSVRTSSTTYSVVSCQSGSV